jgi:thymidylate synthase ThyX
VNKERVYCWDIESGGWRDPYEWFEKNAPRVPGIRVRIITTWAQAKVKAYLTYLWLRGHHIPAEDARYDLPNACKTAVYTTFNFRTWRHVLRQRSLNQHAQWEIRACMKGAHDFFLKEAPLLFNPHTQGHVDQSLLGLPAMLDGGEGVMREVKLRVETVQNVWGGGRSYITQGAKPEECEQISEMPALVVR